MYVRHINNVACMLESVIQSVCGASGDSTKPGFQLLVERMHPPLCGPFVRAVDVGTAAIDVGTAIWPDSTKPGFQLLVERIHPPLCGPFVRAVDVGTPLFLIDRNIPERPDLAVASSPELTAVFCLQS
jgi:hypothetical protein